MAASRRVHRPQNATLSVVFATIFAETPMQPAKQPVDPALKPYLHRVGEKSVLSGVGFCHVGVLPDKPDL